MRKLVAETGNRSAELILDLIYFAEDVSVRLFLDNIFVYDKLSNSDNPKLALITHLFQYMNKYIEMNVTESKEFFELKMRYDENTPDFSSGVPFIEDVYIPLYLHLYALSENYYSYRIITTQSISDVKNSNNICNDFQNNNKGNVSKKGSLAKLLNLLIQSFVHNKFYYCFWGDFLYKIEIKSKIIEKENEERKRSTMRR